LCSYLICLVCLQIVLFIFHIIFSFNCVLWFIDYYNFFFLNRSKKEWSIHIYLLLLYLFRTFLKDDFCL
jgi:hypothetical protein